jgi:Nif-specific regulatory protein
VCGKNFDMQAVGTHEMAVLDQQIGVREKAVDASWFVESGGVDHRMAMATLIEVTRLINSSLVLEEVLRLTLECATRVMDAEAGSVILLDKRSDDLVIKVATGPKGHEAQEERFRKGEGIAGWVAETGEPRIVHDVRQNDHFFREIDRKTGFTTKSILAVPLRVKGEIVGVLEVLNKRGGQSFSGEDLRLFMTFADLAAISIDNAGAYEELRAENRRLQMRLALDRAIIGQSRAMREIVQQIERVAQRPVTVVLRGETGTGKGLVARVIHDRSPRRDRPFVTVDCGTISEGLWESELFGHGKGAFTGAIRDKKGLFEVADKGTIFLDEIGHTSLELQTRLLHVLQEGEIRRVGETQTRRVDVRIIAATNQDLELAVRKGTFREDLFFRLNVFPIVLPPLRERPEDIPSLVDYLTEKYNQELAGRVEGVTPDAMWALMAYPWPGNIRELENVIRRIIVMVEEGNICLEHLPVEIRQMTPGAEKMPSDRSRPAPREPIEHTLDGVERAQITWALEETRGNRSQAARLLGISREKLRYRMQKYRMER